VSEIHSVCESKIKHARFVFLFETKPKNMLIPRSVTARTWKNLFRFCLGLAVAAAFCMKWMESDFVLNKEEFTIIGMELFYPREKLAALLSGLTVSAPDVKNILYYHLSFDFAFMAGVYPGITALCMIGREKATSVTIRKVLLVLAYFQLIAWGADIAENCYLFRWGSFFHPRTAGWANADTIIPDREFMIYRIVVPLKWVLALAGVLFAIPFAVRKRKPGF
jgi:hypothetical protein